MMGASVLASELVPRASTFDVGRNIYHERKSNDEPTEPLDAE